MRDSRRDAFRLKYFTVYLLDWIYQKFSLAFRHPTRVPLRLFDCRKISNAVQSSGVELLFPASVTRCSFPVEPTSSVGKLLSGGKRRRMTLVQFRQPSRTFVLRIAKFTLTHKSVVPPSRNYGNKRGRKSRGVEKKRRNIRIFVDAERTRFVFV